MWTMSIPMTCFIIRAMTTLKALLLVPYQRLLVYGCRHPVGVARATEDCHVPRYHRESAHQQPGDAGACYSTSCNACITSIVPHGAR